MSDEEIRDLLGRGAEDLGPAEGDPAEDLWAAGRRQRSRGRAWVGGLGAAAAAAGILGIVWAQGLAGGQTSTDPADSAPDTATQTSPGPVVEDSYAGRGEPFFAVFHRAETEPPEQLSGASVPATLEDLQDGLWIGPDGEEFTFNGDEFTAVVGGCSQRRGAIALEAGSRLVQVGEWEGTDDLGECTEPPVIPWGAALQAQPMLSLDGETLIISGFDGTTDEPRVPVAMSLRQVDDSGFTWADAPAATGVTPLTLGEDVALFLSGGRDESGFTSIGQVQLDKMSGAAEAAEGADDGASNPPPTCPLLMESSLRADGTLLVGPSAPFTACDRSSDSYRPPFEPSPAVVELLRSGPMIGLNNGTLIVSGTIPESLLDQTAPPIDGEPTSEPPEVADPTGDETGSESPDPGDGIPLVVGTPRLVVMSEGEWAPTGQLTPLTAEEAVGRRWLMVSVGEAAGVVEEPWQDHGLTFDGSALRIRDCSVDVTVPGEVRDGVFVATGEADVVDDPDPAMDCPVPVYSQEWMQILTHEPTLSTDGEILVIAGGTDDLRLEPVGLALVPDGVEEPVGGPMPRVELGTLAGGLSEVPADQARELNVTGVRDAQPEHATTLAVVDGQVVVDVGCAEPLRGPAWFSPLNDYDVLTAVVPSDPDCAGAAAEDAELWGQLLARGVFLHHYGDYVLVDGWADPALGQVDGS